MQPLEVLRRVEIEGPEVVRRGQPLHVNRLQRLPNRPVAGLIGRLKAAESAASVDGAKRLSFAVRRTRNDHVRAGIASRLHQQSQKNGIQERQVAGADQVPFGPPELQGSQDSPEWTIVRFGIIDGFESEAMDSLASAYQRHNACGSLDQTGRPNDKRLPIDLEQGLVSAQPHAPAPGQHPSSEALHVMIVALAKKMNRLRAWGIRL